MSQLNDTSVTLEWSEPLDRGGRTDLTYRLLCAVCKVNGVRESPWQRRDPGSEPGPTPPASRPGIGRTLLPL